MTSGRDSVSANSEMGRLCEKVITERSHLLKQSFKVKNHNEKDSQLL